MSQCIKIQPHEAELYESHVQMIAPKNKVKNRKCLKCGIQFLSRNYSNRLCCQCNYANKKQSPRAESLPEVVR